MSVFYVNYIDGIKLEYIARNIETSVLYVKCMS